MLMLLHVLIVVFKGKEKLMIIHVLSYELELLKHMASEETSVVINQWTRFFKNLFGTY